MNNLLEKYGTLGTVVAAACPICFPKLALLGALFGLGALARSEPAFFYGAHILVVLTLIGHISSYRKVQKKTLLALAIISVVLFFLSLYVLVSEVLSYIALAGLSELLLS